MNKLFAAFALAILMVVIDAVGNPALAQIADINSAINKAGR